MNWNILLRLIVPSWSFFDELGASCQVKYRYGESVISLKNSKWIDLTIPLSRGFKNFFHNPQENFYLFTIGIFENLMHLGTLKKTDLDLCFLLIKNYAPEAKLIQFKILARSSISPIQFEKVYESKISEIANV